MSKHNTARSAPFFSPVCRAAFVYLHSPKTKDSHGKPLERPVHSITLIVPKLNPDPQQCTNYQLFAAPAAQATLQGFNGQFPQNMNWPIKDGDVATKPDTFTKYPWRRGHWIVEASNTFPVGVAIAQNGQAVAIPSQNVGGRELYKPGDFCIASLYAYTYDNRTFGVNFNLEAVVWTGEGERIGNAGGRSLEAVFGGMQIPGGMTPAFPSHVPSGPAGIAAPGMVPQVAPTAQPVPGLPGQGAAPFAAPPMASPAYAPAPNGMPAAPVGAAPMPSPSSGLPGQSAAPLPGAAPMTGAPAATAPNGTPQPGGGGAAYPSNGLPQAPAAFQPFPPR